MSKKLMVVLRIYRATDQSEEQGQSPPVEWKTIWNGANARYNIHCHNYNCYENPEMTITHQMLCEATPE